MEDVKRARYLNAVNLTASIKNKEGYQIDLKQHISLINNLEIRTIFKNKTKEKGVGVIDLIYRAVQVLRENLYWIKISARDAGLIEPVKLQDKGQSSYITSHESYIKYTHVLNLLTQYIEYIRTSERSNHYYKEELGI